VWKERKKKKSMQGIDLSEKGGERKVDSERGFGAENNAVHKKKGKIAGKGCQSYLFLRKTPPVRRVEPIRGR